MWIAEIKLGMTIRLYEVQCFHSTKVNVETLVHYVAIPIQNRGDSNTYSKQLR